jgi:NDP-sugar pyrophosphorylase family protein
MKAMILAAGLGTRLRPLTSDRPKALVEINGRTLLELAIARLKAFGVTEIIVNVHHFADQVLAYLEEQQCFGLRIEVSREDDLLLDTGGGLKKASWFFTDARTGRDRPFFLHNVDVLSSIDLRAMLAFHCQHQALATLAVQSRATSRPLVFSAGGQLVGRAGAKAVAPVGPDPSRREPAGSQLLAFSGIHVLSPSVFRLLEETGSFSIIEAYVRLSRAGHKIIAFPADQYLWRDLGRPADLAAAAMELQNS